MLRCAARPPPPCLHTILVDAHVDLLRGNAPAAAARCVLISLSLSQLRQAMEVLGCQSWDVGAVLTTDKEVSRLNRQVRLEIESAGGPNVAPKYTSRMFCVPGSQVTAVIRKPGNERA